MTTQNLICSLLWNRGPWSTLRAWQFRRFEEE